MLPWERFGGTTSAAPTPQPNTFVTPTSGPWSRFQPAAATPPPQAPRVPRDLDVSEFGVRDFSREFAQPDPFALREQRVRQSMEPQAEPPEARRKKISQLRRSYLDYIELVPFLDELEQDQSLDSAGIEREFLYAVAQVKRERDAAKQQQVFAEKAAKNEERRFEKFRKEQLKQEEKTIAAQRQEAEKLEKKAIDAEKFGIQQQVKLDAETIRAQAKAPPPERAQPTRRAVQREPTLGQTAAGMGAEILIGGAGQATGAALAPFTAGISYPVLSFAGGFAGSLTAQEIEGRREVSYGRAIRDGLLNLIPGLKPVKGATTAARVVKAAAKSAAVGVPTGVAGEVIEKGIEEERLPTFEEMTKGGLFAGTLGAGFGASGEALKSAFRKFAGKPVSELDKAYARGDKDAALIVEATKGASKDVPLTAAPAPRVEEPVITPEPITPPARPAVEPAPTPTPREATRQMEEEISRMAAEPTPIRPTPKATSVRIGETIFNFRDGEWYREGSTIPVKSTTMLRVINEEASRAIPIRETETIPMGEGAGNRPPVDQRIREQAPAVKAEDQVPQAEVTPPLVPATRKELQSEAKRVGVPSTGTTKEMARLVDIAKRDPSTWTREEFDAISPYLSVHQVVKRAGQTTEELDRITQNIAERGLTSGMVDPVESFLGKGRWSWANELGDRSVIVFSKNIKYRGDSPNIESSGKPIAIIRTDTPIQRGNADALFEAIRSGSLKKPEQPITPTMAPEAPISRQREEGVPAAAETETPGYKAARDPLLARATELGIDTKGTNAELQARITKREKVLSFIDDVERGAKERLAELQKTTTLGVNKPLGMAIEYTTIGAAKMARGTIKFADWSREMVSEFGDAIKPYLRQIYQRAITINRKDFESPDEFRSFSEKMAEGLQLKTKDVEAVKPPVVPETPPTTVKPEREVGLRKALSEAERKEFDLAPPPEKIQKEVEVEWTRSEEKFAKDPNAGKRLTDEILGNLSRAINDEESAVLLRHKRNLATELDAASDALSKAKTEAEQADAKARFDAALGEYEKVINAAESSGTVWGRAGVWKQLIAKEDYSLARMITKAKSANGGKDLTPERQAQVAAQNKRITELQAKVNELESRSGTETVAKIAAEENVKKGRGQKPTFEEEPPVNAAKMGQSIKDLARYFVGKGITDRTELVKQIHEVVVKVDPELTPRDVQDAFSDYGKFRPLSKDEIDVKLRDLRQQLQQVSKLEDMEAGTAPKKTGMERQAPSDEARRLIQQVNEAKKRGGYDVTDPERQLASAMQTIKKRLTDQIADLEYQIKTRTKIVKEKRGIEYDAEAKALQARRDELRQEFDAIFGRPEMTDEQRVNQALAAINRSIEDLNRRIKTGDLFPTKKPSKTPETPEIAAARAEREALREQLKELQLIARPKKTPEEISLQAYKTRMKNQIAELERKRAAGDFTTKPKKERVMDEEATELYYQLDKAKQEYNKSLIEDRWNNYSRKKKIWEYTKDVSSNLTRALITAIDLPVLRQGGFFFVTRPITSIKAIPSAFKALVSEKAQFKVMEEIRRRPSYKAMKAAGLEITETTGANLAKQEETFRGRLVEKIPRVLGGGLVRGSQRAYETYMNKIRADVFDSMSKTLSRSTSASPEEQKAIATMINVASGRGDVTPGQAQVLAGASNFFFAPRYAISRFQLALGQPLLKGIISGEATGTWKAKKLIAAEYARYLGGMAAFYSMIHLRNELKDEEAEEWKIDFDPRSSEFGKVKIGNTRIDVLSGLSQVVTFLSRLSTGETKTASGVKVLREAGRPLNYFREDNDPMKTEKLKFGQADIRDTLGDFLERKVSPAVSIFSNIVAQKRMFEREGEEAGYGPVELAQDLVIPLSIRDIYEAMLDQGIPKATAYAMLAFFGLSTQTYKTKEPKPRESGSMFGTSFGLGGPGGLSGP